MRGRRRQHRSHAAHASDGDDRCAGDLYHPGCRVGRHDRAEDGGDFGCWELREGRLAEDRKWA